MKPITAEQVVKLLPMQECINVMKTTLQNLEMGEGQQYLRTVQPLPRGLLGFMPAYLNKQYFGAKLITVFHENMGSPYPSHQGSVMLYNAHHGTPLAAVDGGEITRIRTGAVSAVATDALAPKNAGHAAFLGAGAQAYSHLRGLALVRPLKLVTVYDINTGRAEEFATWVQQQYGVAAKACPTPAAAVQEADIITTVTMSATPLIDLGHVKPGAHINAVGACRAQDRELGSDLVAAAKVYGDNRESVMAESGDFLLPMKEGLFDETHLRGTVGQMLLHRCPGRQNAEEITLFIALGLAVEDVACAAYIYEKLQ